LELLEWIGMDESKFITNWRGLLWRTSIMFCQEVFESLFLSVHLRFNCKTHSYLVRALGIMAKRSALPRCGKDNAFPCTIQSIKMTDQIGLHSNDQISASPLHLHLAATLLPCKVLVVVILIKVDP
jgi:hypothetical protein